MRVVSIPPLYISSPSELSPLKAWSTSATMLPNYHHLLWLDTSVLINKTLILQKQASKVRKYQSSLSKLNGFWCMHHITVFNGMNLCDFFFLHKCSLILYRHIKGLTSWTAAECFVFSSIFNLQPHALFSIVHSFKLWKEDY